MLIHYKALCSVPQSMMNRYSPQLSFTATSCLRTLSTGRVHPRRDQAERAPGPPQAHTQLRVPGLHRDPQPYAALPHRLGYRLPRHLRSLVPSKACLYLPSRPRTRVHNHLPSISGPLSCSATLRFHGVRHLHLEDKDNLRRFPSLG